MKEPMRWLQHKKTIAEQFAHSCSGRHCVDEQLGCVRSACGASDLASLWRWMADSSLMRTHLQVCRAEACNHSAVSQQVALQYTS